MRNYSDFPFQVSQSIRLISKGAMLITEVILIFLGITMVVEVVVGVAEEGAEATTNKRGVATEEVGVAKTVHNIAELKTSEKRRKMHYNKILLWT